MPFGANDLWITASTIWGEARGEPVEGQYAVAHVILNRSVRRKLSPAQVCQQPWQFSCWLKNDPNMMKMLMLDLGNPVFCRLVRIALEVLSGYHASNVGSAAHYYADSIVAPAWAVGQTPVAHIGHHLFFEGIA